MEFYKKLVEYFENTPQEEIDKAWDATKEWDEVGPTIGDLGIWDQIKREERIKKLKRILGKSELLL